MRKQRNGGRGGCRSEGLYGEGSEQRLVGRLTNLIFREKVYSARPVSSNFPRGSRLSGAVNGGDVKREPRKLSTHAENQPLLVS